MNLVHILILCDRFVAHCSAARAPVGANDSVNLKEKMYQTKVRKIGSIAINHSCDTGGENADYTGWQFERGLNPSADVSACPSWQQ